MRSYIWESASKPMFVKSVWLDVEGYHRVILDREKPKKKVDPKGIRRSHSEREIAEKDQQLLQCIAMDLGSSKEYPRRKATKVINKKSDTTYVRHQLKKQEKKGGYKGQLAHSDFEPPTIVVEMEQKNEVVKAEKNHLTERVLQWLDKSGKSSTMVKDKEIFLEDVDELIKKSTEYSKRKSAPLRRAESVHHLHLTFNDDDYIPDPYVSGRCKSAAVDQYNRPVLKKSISLNSRNSIASSQQSTAALPSTANILLSMNNLALDNENNQVREEEDDNSSPNKRVTGGGGGGNRKNRKQLKRKDTLIENQYKHLIHKHILETTCNTQIVKRQLHIFIPKLKKKQATQPHQISNAIDNGVEKKVQSAVNDCESASCFSSVEGGAV